MATKTKAGDGSVYNANTNWANEEKYLSGLANGGNKWAAAQLSALKEAQAKYAPAQGGTDAGAGLRAPKTWNDDTLAAVAPTAAQSIKNLEAQGRQEEANALRQQWLYTKDYSTGALVQDVQYDFSGLTEAQKQTLENGGGAASALLAQVPAVTPAGPGVTGSGVAVTGGAGAGGSGGDIPAAGSKEAYIRELYEAQQRAALAALESAYRQNVIDIDASASEIPALYQAARDRTAAEAAVARSRFGEYAAASGLNNGAAGQAQLSMENALQGELSGLSGQEAQALAEVETARRKTTATYQDAVAQAIASGDLARAQALYQEAVRVDESIMDAAIRNAQLAYQQQAFQYQAQQDSQAAAQQRAAQLAQQGDFSGYRALGYTEAQIQAMQAVWAAQNPALASALGHSASPGYSADPNPADITPARTGSAALSTPAAGTTALSQINLLLQMGQLKAAAELAEQNASGMTQQQRFMMESLFNQAGVKFRT